MIFLINQYRVLWAIINFSYKYTHTKSSMTPMFNELKISFMLDDTIFKHCCLLHRFGYINMIEATTNNSHILSVTPEGMHYALKLRHSIVSTIVSFIISLISLVIGFILGRIP